MAAQQAAEQAAAAAREKAQKEKEAMDEAKRAADEARLRAEAAARASSEEAKRKAAEAEEERKRTAALQEQAKRDAQAAQEQAKKLREAADEERRKAAAAQESANAAKKEAEEQVKTANAAKEEAERKLKEGIQPVVTPTPEEVSAAKQKVQYREHLFHLAVAGVAGAGKSSLINAFCGLRNKTTGAAATGVAETTLAMARFPHPNAEYPLVLYDIPGAGTLKIPDWQYFNDQGLYVFDGIIVLFDNRFTMTDIAILTNCRRFKIPTYIVRSKADQHILNIMNDMGYDSDDDDSGKKKKKLYQTARQEFIEQTRQSVKDNLENADMPDQRVYIVSNKTMIDVMSNTTIFGLLGRKQAKAIDETELLNDLIREAQARRGSRDAEDQVMAANAAKEEAERKLKEGIQPVVTPSPEEVSVAKRNIQYCEGLFHFAVAGVAGVGKSSLINAFCGLRNNDVRAAATGVTETTLAMARIPHPDAEYPLVWYDIPGAGTLKISDWWYFNTQGLYIFDGIIILFDNRFTMTDIAILTNCRRFNIPTYIVRSKADQHISNIMDDMEDVSDHDESENKKKKLYQVARQRFIQQTRQSVKDNLENANIPDQKVYIVSNKTMIDVVKTKQAVRVIDEIELLNDLIQETQTRRGHHHDDVEVVTITNDKWTVPMIELLLFYLFLRVITSAAISLFST
ncbi:interferon-inducible GTPase-domain-containing protein [Suillus bovinus]|uniref:interferon-inducible GTPase-domain-containing protein n=1 Tax=Suillus bovinus TaxID=48563 RepID=UPI001B864DB8|nr:interferon-inducible GTPase-domain-containing protein [Suillus bovinus]KAG2135730.1 interferon-inducible GTPase-domain-containing protein [Suillus bovinus]